MNVWKPCTLVLVPLTFLLAACVSGSRQELPPLKVVEQVDLNRYAGTWYEIASIPNRFQRDCVATRATYTPREDGTIQVENECRRSALEGEIRRIKGTAWVVDQAVPAKLKVQFFWPFRGDYWIIALDDQYRYAVVGHPSRDYLWILSRTPTLDPALYQNVLAGIEAQGYDLNRIQLTPQSTDAGKPPAKTTR